MDEIYKDVDGFPGYSVSNLGNVKGLRGNVLKPKFNKNDGYWYVSLQCCGKQHCKKIHRLVAIAFILNPDNKSEVDHKDNCRTNNSVDNLRWATHKENMANLKARGKSGVKGVCYVARYNKYVAQIQIDGIHKNLGYFDTIDAAGDAYKAAAVERFGEFAKC
jgi:hypothetical protein